MNQMNQMNYNFESEKLSVDWISLNLKDLTDFNSIYDIAVYLSKFGFNSTKFQENIIGKKELIFLSENKFNANFKVHAFNGKLGNYWTGTIIIFSGSNAKKFYQTIKSNTFEWKYLNLKYLSLGRFDLNYFNEITGSDLNDRVEFFMQKTCDQNENKGKKINSKWSIDGQNRILRIGKRRSSNYYRVYQNSDGLKFELEMKGKITKFIEKYFFSKNFITLENILSKHFYKISVNNLFLDSCCTSWLSDRIRKLLVINQPFGLTYLVSHYLDEFEPIRDQLENFMGLLEFLSFIRNLNVSKEFLFKEGYYRAKFPIRDFLKFKGIENPNQRTIEKTVNLFLSFQNLKPLVRYFGHMCFSSSVIFPQLKVTREAGKAYMVSFVLLEDLYLKDYPFAFPKSFFSYQNKYELYLKFEFIRSFCNLKVKKQFNVKSFLNQFNISQKNKANIKKLICSLFKGLVDSNIIESEFELQNKNGSLISVSRLTPLNISKSDFIYFYEVLVKF